MRASMLIRVEGDRVVDLHADPPLGAKVRQTSRGPEVHLVTTAASLLEGDVLEIDLRLGVGSRLTVRSVAAQVAHPCLDGGSTALHLRASVADGASLAWLPQPTIVCAGADHRATTELSTEGTGRVVWFEEVVLGRSGEDRTDLRLDARLSAARADVPVLEDGLLLDRSQRESWTGPAVLGDARYVGSRLVVGEDEDAFDWLLGAADGACRIDGVRLAAGGELLRIADGDPLHGRARLHGGRGTDA